jgi:hypothetical protein
MTEHLPTHNAFHSLPPHNLIPNHTPYTTHTVNRKRSFYTLRPRPPRRSIFHTQVGVYHSNPEIMGGRTGPNGSGDRMGRDGRSQGNEEDL